MKKIILSIVAGLAIFASSTFASGNVTTWNIGTWSTGSVLKKETVMCIKTAALTREGYLQAAYRTFTDAVIVAYLRRSEAIKAAYEAANSMKEARPIIKTAFDTWRETVKKAREVLKKERQDRWNLFKDDVKKCRPDRNNYNDATQDANWQQRSEGNIL